MFIVMGCFGNDFLQPKQILSIVLALYVLFGIMTFWMLMLINCIHRNFEKRSSKTGWFLLLLFLHIVAAPIYYFKFVFKEKQEVPI